MNENKKNSRREEQMISERTETIKRTLEYYEFKLSELVESEDEPNDVNSLLLEDIRSNTHKLRQACSLVITGNVEKLIHEYRSEVCCALITYIAGLENSKKSASEKLPGAKLSFDHIDREIELADQVKKELCKYPR
jgi:hypothetical protein